MKYNRCYHIHKPVKEAKTDIIRDVQKQSHIRHKGCEDNRSVHKYGNTDLIPIYKHLVA